MKILPHISIRQLNYSINTDKSIFKDLNLEITHHKIGLVGRNGVGKTTLLKLLLNELKPCSGIIEISGTIAYCPQKLDFNDDSTIADVLDVQDKLQALKRIEQGSVAENDFNILNDDWDIHEKIITQLKQFKLEKLSLDRKVSSLSGGERTRVLLIKAFLQNPDFIFLDEPTNNLDKSSREFLYEVISQWKKGMIIISHDRNLLNIMEKMIEITSLGVNCYGGNYQHYFEQKELMLQAKQKNLIDAKEQLQNKKNVIQQTREKFEKKRSQGRKNRLAGNIDKMAADSKKGRGEKTQKRNSTQNDIQLTVVAEKYIEAKSQLEINDEIRLDLSNTFVPNGKIIVNIEKLYFQYKNKETAIIQNFNCKIVGAERIAIVGDNGSGKSTLIKLLLRELTPQSGDIYIGVEDICYLDQTISQFNDEMTVIENYLLFNPEIDLTTAHFNLAQCLFKNTEGLKKVKDLSGGERLRAMLACVLLAKKPPKLLILDEPTNHLDLNSIMQIESALKNYQGAMIVVSHDKNFLENIGVMREIHIPLVNEEM